MSLIPFFNRLSGAMMLVGETDDDDKESVYDLVHTTFGRKGAVIETREQWRNVLAVRVYTGVNDEAPRGAFDDYIIVSWLGAGATKNAQVFKGNTEPSYQYSEEGHTTYGKDTNGQDANNDGKKDLGMLPSGVYTYNAVTSTHRVLGNIFRPSNGDSRGVRVLRDINHDGFFNQADEDLVTNESRMYEGNTMYIHRASRNAQRLNTWSAGCQTLRFEDFELFRTSIAEGNRAGQSLFKYVLTDVLGLIF